MYSPLYQLQNITKSFPGVVAIDNVSLALHEGIIHAIIGENGAGKSTLMGILYGRYTPDSGRILRRGEEVRILDPAAAAELGIGPVAQHSTMIPALTALENVALGSEPVERGGIVDWELVRSRVREIADKLGTRVDWDCEAGSLSVAALQKVEIVKALYRGAKVLILDEPTAMLAPQEADALFAVIHGLVSEGVTVVLVTHKLGEVMAHSDRVTVLRTGKVTGDRLTAETYPEELVGLMLGRTTASPGVALASEPPVTGEYQAGWERGEDSERKVETMEFQALPVLEVRDLTVVSEGGGLAIRRVNLEVKPGQALGIAGVDGSGQRELAQAIVGLRPAASGRVLIGGTDVSSLDVARRQREGLAYVPEDRHREGLILDFSIAENLLLGVQRHRGFGGGRTLNLSRVAANADAAVRNHRIRAAGAMVPARALSGGNQQKVVVARALETHPRILVAMQPTRGLDVDATRSIYSKIRQALADGMGMLLFSLDMDEIMELSDRIAVLYNGQIVGLVERERATVDDIGRLMVEGHE